MSRRKRLGQHFLNDEEVVSSIIRSANLSSSDIVLEIGPGKGVLTRPMAEIVKKIYAIEIDHRLITRLQKELSLFNNLFLINEDALKMDYSEIERPFKVISNLPYNISTAIALKLVHEIKGISEMVLMFQKEVADRLTAVPGTRSYGSLSVFVQYWAKPEFLFNVSKESFSPPPKIESSVIRLTPLKERPVAVLNEPLFFDVIKASFTGRRKRLKNSLKSLSLPDTEIGEALEKCGIDSGRRGETLSMEEFASLANLLNEKNKKN